MSQRKLKVQSKHVKSSASSTGLKLYPSITLSGKWVEDIGINYGDTVSVEVENNKIIIRNMVV